MNLLLNSLYTLRNSISKLPITILIGNHVINRNVKKDLNIIATGYLPKIEDVFSYLFASDFALLPMQINLANKARWPSKIADYLVAGLPVIATPVSDFQEIFNKYRVGLLSGSDSVEIYTGVLLQALDLSDAERKELSRSARDYAEKELDWGILVKRLEELYHRTIETAK